MPNPPAPEITHGEFPFRLEYMMGGEKFVVEDVFIAEFDGFGWNAGEWRYRRWRGWIKGSGERMVLLLDDEEKRIYITVGGARYYMGDERHQGMGPLIPQITVVKNNAVGGTTISGPSDELLAQYGIELISWELSPPIVNSFR